MQQRTPRSTPRRSRRRETRLGLLIFCLAVVGILLIVSPTAPIDRARNIGPDGKLISAFEGLRISEIMSDNSTAFPDENGNFPDWFEIVSTSAQPMNLDGVTASNRLTRPFCVLPLGHHCPGRMIVYCDSTNQTTRASPFTPKFKLASLGCAVPLFDTSGFVVDKVEDVLAHQRILRPCAGWQLSEDRSLLPRLPQHPGGHQALSSYYLESGTLVINELCPAPRSGLRDEDDELSDWIELKNNSDSTIDLSNIALVTTITPHQVVFPGGAVIAPGLLPGVLLRQKPGEPGLLSPHQFSLKAEGDRHPLPQRADAGRVKEYENIPTWTTALAATRGSATGRCSLSPPRSPPTTPSGFHGGEVSAP